MPCSTATLDVSPVCILPLNSPTRQQVGRIILLAGAVGALDGGFDPSDWASIRTEANAAAPCVYSAAARVKQAQIINNGLAGEEYNTPTEFDCDSPDVLARIELYLTCLLIDQVNP